MVTLLEYRGVRVFSLAEDTTEMDAFATWRGETPFVFLNSRKSSEASRFDAAHELGHLVLHKHGPPSGRTAERQAHAFAAALLMPATSVFAYAPKNPTLSKLVKAKHYWNVSVAALAHRMHALALVSDWRYRGLCIELQEAGFRDNEPESAPREKSQVFEKVFQALRQDGIGKKELAAQLQFPVAEIDALVFDLVLSAMPGGGKGSPSPGERPSLHLVK
jgi:Zn-dependent peptidase ImmA (M78 family)